MKLTDVEGSGDSIFFPALEQNMMGVVLINDIDEVLFLIRQRKNCGDIVGTR